MQTRLSPKQVFELCPRFLTHIPALGETPKGVAITAQLRHLVKLRASQLNHCGYCQKMHSDEARNDGEQQARLDVLPAWRELNCFSAEERAALAWTEAVTCISVQQPDDQLYKETLAVFGEQGVVELTALIIEINSWNRIAVSFGFQPEV
ncbi:carboxymuconolactone decarboxylase family protein [Planctobacterium marinum]|uniref:carboxymuconolactone decarboxylase family protein n=1 Tax=Planctobacterium marinum TaxID=1631968 RepID=UPI001E4CC5AF|nr:carboxymuconolactone decarboxylase family protein [Planctobacterium marinum]MCC2605902.1 carboxymuconolactone decarboxylase family protein [Planctobacterium marinum]